MDSVFRVLEPVIGKINEKAKAPGGLSRFGFGAQRSDWFRIFRVSISSVARINGPHILCIGFLLAV